METGKLFSFSLNLHTEWFVALLKTTHSEVFQGVHIVSKVQSALLPNPKGTGGDKGLSINFSECGVSCRWINQQLSVEREHYKENNMTE